MATSSDISIKIRKKLLEGKTDEIATIINTDPQNMLIIVKALEDPHVRIRQNAADTLGIIGASAALYFSDIPFTTPVGAVKVGYLNDKFVINPTVKQFEESSLNMVVVGTEEGIVVIEAGASEIEEEKIIEGVAFASETIIQIIEAQKELYNKLHIQKRKFSAMEVNQANFEKIEN